VNATTRAKQSQYFYLIIGGVGDFVLHNVLGTQTTHERATLFLVSGSQLPFSQFIGRRASRRAWDRHLVLCACLGLLREVSQTQAAVEERYTTTTTAIYHTLLQSVLG
jgi:hypothetical protein